MVTKKNHTTPAVAAALLLFIATFFSVLVNQTHAQAAAGDYIFYDDELALGWENWSWNTTVDLSETSTVKVGSNALAAKYDEGWAGLRLHNHNPIATADYTDLHFWLHGGNAGGQKIRVLLVDDNSSGAEPVVITATANQWTEHTISLAQLDAPTMLAGIFFTEDSGNSQQKMYIDDLRLVARDPGEPTPTPPPSSQVSVQIDTSQVTYNINPHIYGLNFAEEGLAAELDLPLNRWGGNAVTRYNYKIDVSNRGSDWFFENISSEPASLARLPMDSTADLFVADNMQRETSTLMTMPIIGWTPRARDNSCGYSVSKYGEQAYTDYWRPDCGNGESSSGERIEANSPSDTSIVIDEGFVLEWIEHLTDRFGTAEAGGVGFYSLDNEPMLWDHTHRDVHPDPVTYDELRDRSITYGAAIKAADPSAKTLGPVLWGWTAYEYSAADAASGQWSNPPDRLAHDDMPVAEWYLKEMAAHEAATGTRILDYFDLHYYPQNQGVPLTSAGNTATRATRLRSTRSLWDPNYVDESWIGEPVQLIRRMQNWVDTQYPGTGLSLSEYNWGGLEHINGALAQADILGIFGREGLDMAMLWDPPQSDQPGAYALRMFRNYDGQGGKFGNEGFTSVSSDVDQLAVYTARRSADSAITIMVINKALAPVSAQINISGQTFSPNYERYRYSTANLNAIEHDSLTAASNLSSALSEEFPADSITLFELTAGDAPSEVVYTDFVYLPLAISE